MHIDRQRFLAWTTLIASGCTTGQLHNGASTGEANDLGTLALSDSESGSEDLPASGETDDVSPETELDESSETQGSVTGHEDSGWESTNESSSTDGGTTKGEATSGEATSGEATSGEATADEGATDDETAEDTEVSSESESGGTGCLDVDDHPTLPRICQDLATEACVDADFWTFNDCSHALDYLHPAAALAMAECVAGDEDCGRPFGICLDEAVERSCPRVDAFEVCELMVEGCSDSDTWNQSTCVKAASAVNDLGRAALIRCSMNIDDCDWDIWNCIETLYRGVPRQ